MLIAFFCFSQTILGSSSPPSKEVPSLYEQIMKCDVTQANVLVVPPDGKQWLCGLGEGQSLFVRGCYAWFYNEAIKRMAVVPKCPGLIYTGNPGIGKSAWLNYALVRFLQEGFAVILERAKMKDYLLFQDGICTHKEKRVRQSVLSELPAKAVYLFDPDEGDSCPLESNVFTIVASSPQEKHYKALRKLENSCVRYFPCWSLEELKLARPNMDKQILEERWLRWGGIPRYIYDENQEKLLGILNETVDHVNLELVEKCRFTAEIPEHQQTFLSHVLVHYAVKEPYERGELDFASEWIGQQVVVATAKRDYKALITHYEHTRHQEWQGAYRGHLWEHLCHAIIPLGTKDGLKLERLNKKQNRFIIKGAVAIEKGKLEDMLVALGKGCYFQPSARNFPVFDAMVMEGNDVYGLQMTVASSHPPKAYHAARLLESILAGRKLHLVWVVDGAKEDHIRTVQSFKQSKTPAKKVDASMIAKLQNLPQWVLKLPFPKESPFIKK
jgi:hypothetical protein